MGLRHFLLTIPLGSLIITGLVMYVIPAMNLRLNWYELYVLICGVNIAVTVLAYVLMPPGFSIRRRKAE
jgi:hypothetical protein